MQDRDTGSPEHLRHVQRTQSQMGLRQTIHVLENDLFSILFWQRLLLFLLKNV
jgi:hypothetical protein